MGTRGAWAVVGAGLLLVLGGCGDDSGGSTDESTTTSAAVSSTSTTATTAPTTTTSEDPDVATSLYTPIPGTVCDLGSDPDCIDPDGNGSGTYLTDGAECMATFADSPELCSDLDGDGVAGYPDSG